MEITIYFISTDIIVHLYFRPAGKLISMVYLKVSFKHSSNEFKKNNRTEVIHYISRLIGVKQYPQSYKHCTHSLK